MYIQYLYFFWYGVLIFTFVSKYYLKKEIIKIFGIGTLVVVTGSMEPTINIKEMIIIKEQNDYKVGDIVTYKDSKGKLVTHRIVSKAGNKIITRGDNNTVSDDPININQIEGKIYYHSAVLGEIFLYWIKPVLFVLSCLLFINILRSTILLRRKNKWRGKLKLY